MPRRVSWRCPPDAAGTRLDAWLAQALGDVSRAAAAALIEAGAVLVDGARRPKSTRLQGGEQVRVEAAPARPGPPRRRRARGRVGGRAPSWSSTSRPASWSTRPRATAA